MKHRSKKSLRTLRRKNVASVKKRRYTRKHGGNQEELREEADEAIYQGDLERLQQVIARGLYINGRDERGHSLLDLASGMEDINIIDYLILQDADVTSQDKNGNTVLYNYVTLGDNVDIVKSLIEYGADVNQENNYGRTPLTMASHHGNMEIVKYLVEHGAEVNGGRNGTALITATDKNHPEIVKYLLQHGADINVQNTYGQTPFDIATDMRYSEIIDILAPYVTTRRVLPNNATNAITYNEINFTKPLMNFGKEYNHGRYYQNKATVRNIQRTLRNPFTREKVNRNSIKWYMATRKNKNNKNNKNKNKQL